MVKKQDVATDILSFLMLLFLMLNQFMFQAPARIGIKKGLTAKECLGANYVILLGITTVLFFLVIIKGEKENLNFLAGIMASLCLGFAILFAGQAVNVVEVSSPNGRVSMSIGCYLYIVIAYLVEVKCNEYIEKKWKRFIVIALGGIIAIMAFVTGQMSGLSIMKEYLTYRKEFANYFVNHISMSFKVVISGIICGIPLGWCVYKFSRIGKIITIVLNTIESIPSLALICVMMFPLSFLSNKFPILKEYGISGVGATPVFCALFCYSLFQIVNSMYGALKVVDKQYIDAAKGMGMTTLQIFTQIEFPIIMPIIISGIRVSLTSTILGVTIGSYIGYGGLGKFILQGLNGFAIDIVMLGTLPIMGMVFLFDFILKKLVDFIEFYRKTKGVVNV
ncbi:ABC transporter permease [Dorea sp. Marseille-P4042]|uniref:ABC transporter permease n=1 Tax=Dorea sp. Marseille-P4042 TaxID=2080749 RepID=UPI000CF9F1B9|nr:ABC transporter permease [Dorea sp. Marseille-P4042]